MVTYDQNLKQIKSTNEPRLNNLKAGNSFIEIKVGVTALRSVRTGLLELAYTLVEHPASQGFLVLPDVSVTRNRLRQEWQLASSVLRPDVLNRISLCIEEEDHWGGIPQDPNPQTQRIISEKVSAGRPALGVRLTRPDYSFMVGELLIHQWLLERGPMTSDWIAKTLGCTYQTVAKALRPLGDWLIRHSDRRIELRCFPREEWGRLAATSEKARGTIRFTDRSGQPRSPESLMQRLHRLCRSDLAIGGVQGAKHYYPPLDLVGSPRLDVSLFCPGRAADLSFVERLDPALVRTERREDPVRLAVHLVRRRDPIFSREPDGIAWADPVECLFDLHEARLEPQAREFLYSFPPAKGQL